MSSNNSQERRGGDKRKHHNDHEEDQKAAKTPRVSTNCPLNKEELGRSAWALFHTMAARFPTKPSDDEQRNMRRFFHYAAATYPCLECRGDFIDMVERNPPVTSSRWTLSQWLCNLHNTVNRKLGKPIFDCKSVLKRWSTGWPDGSCDFDDEEDDGDDDDDDDEEEEDDEKEEHEEKEKEDEERAEEEEEGREDEDL